MVSNDRVGDKNGVSTLLYNGYEGLIACTGGDINRRRDDGVGKAVNPASTTIVVLLLQLRLSNIFV